MENIPAWVPIVVAIPLAMVLAATRLQASIYARHVVVLGGLASIALLFVN